MAALQESRRIGFHYPRYFLRQLRRNRRVKSAKQQEELFGYGKEMVRYGISNTRIRVWNCSALERRN